MSPILLGTVFCESRCTSTSLFEVRLILFLRDHSLLNSISLISKLGFQLNFIRKPIFILHICFLVDTLVMYMFFIYFLTFPMTLLVIINPSYMEEENQEFPGDGLKLAFCKNGYKLDFFIERAPYMIRGHP